MRKGIVIGILERGIKELRKEGCEVGFLCTNIEKLGKLILESDFIHLEENIRQLENLERYFDVGGMVVPIKSKEVFDKILGDKNISDLQGHICLRYL